MSVWFEGSSEVNCSIERVKHDLENLGEHYVEVIRLMPGMTEVDLVDQAEDFVTIRTNEGLMKRTNIIKRIKDEQVVVAFEEAYQAGRAITTKSQFLDEFTMSETGVTHRLIMSNVEAPGLMGFFYRKFGSANMGKAFLSAYRTYFER